MPGVPPANHVEPATYHQRIHEDQSNLIPLDPQAFIEKALDLLASGRYLEKGMGLMALTGRHDRLAGRYPRRGHRFARR